jgi:hypothetical protein
MFISFNQQCKFVENRANNNIDKKEDFNLNGDKQPYVIPTTCPVCSELKGGLCQPKYCPFGKTCVPNGNPKKGYTTGECYTL